MWFWAVKWVRHVFMRIIQCMRAVCVRVCVCVCVNICRMCVKMKYGRTERGIEMFSSTEGNVLYSGLPTRRSLGSFLHFCSFAAAPSIAPFCWLHVMLIFQKAVLFWNIWNVCVCVCVRTVFWLHTSPQAAAETVSLDSRERYGELLAKKTLVFQSCWQCSVYYSLSHSLCPILMWSISVISVNLCFRFPLACSAALLLARYANRNIVCSNLE